MWTRLLPVLGLVALLAAAARADEPPAAQILGVNSDAEARLAEANKKIDSKRYADALDALQALIHTSGNDLVPVGAGRYVQLRWLCHRTIAELPANALKVYRQRVEAQVRKLLDQAGDPPDERILRRVVDEYFCSGPAEAALHRLGDLAFERGRFAEADRWWQQLLPDDRLGTARLTYPIPEGTPALVAAKMLLSRWFRTDRGAWKVEVDLFRKKYPGAEGTLAGQTGKLIDLVEKLTADEKDPVQAARQWTTFAGSSARSLVLPDEPTRPAALARLTRLGKHREFPLGPADRNAGKVTSVAEAARSLAFHPVIVDGQVLVADARYVTGYDLKSGKKEVWFDATTEIGNFDARLGVPAPPDLRYTLSVADDCVLARLGAQEIGPDRDAPTVIVCLERTPGKRLRWKATLDTTAGPAYFEGTPVLLGRSCYVAVTRFTGGHTVTSIHCYPLDVRGTATPRWTREVCKTRELQGKDTRVRHHLLTVAGPNVVYCSHSGAIVALDTDTGRRAWGVTYQGKAEKTGRDLVPCVFAGGRVFAAPADANRLLALDPLTGEALWDRDGIDVVQILGTAQARVIFTTLTPKPGIRAVAAGSGADRFAWFQPGDGGALPSFGQGLLAGDRVYWPTAERVYVLNQVDGGVPEDPTQLKGIPSGNLAFGEGCLAVADRTTLHVFTPPGFDLDERENDVEKEPGSGMAHYRLGVAQRDAGRWNAALTSFVQAQKLARPGEWAQGRPLAETARAERYGTLLDAAEAAQRGEGWKEADDWLKAAGDGQFPPSQRGEALRRRVLLWTAADRPERAVAVCQALLDDEALRDVLLPDSTGHFQRARVWAERTLAGLVTAHGAKVYAEIEKRAAALLEAPGERREHLRQLADRYPHAEATHATLLELAALEEKAGRPGEAAGAYRQWLRRAASGEERARVEAELAGLTDAPAPSPPALDLPLRRDWHHDGAGRLILANSGQFFCEQDGGAFDLQGNRLWPETVKARPEWVGHEGELALLGTPEGLSAVHVRGGGRVWRYPSDVPLGEFASAGGRVFAIAQRRRLLALDAFTGELLWQCAAPAAFRARPVPGGRFDRIARATDRFVFARLGDGRIWKLDAETGELLADEPATSMQQVRYCDAGSGKVRWTHAVEGRTTLNGEPPCLLVRGGQAMLLIGRNYGQTLQRLDMATGKPIWEREALLGDQADPRGFSADERACYFAHDGKLKALALEDGKALWAVALPGQAKGWRTARAGELLVAWPVESAAVRFLYRAPLGSVEWKLERGWEAHTGEGLPVLLLDAQTGKLAQRLNLEVPPGPAEFHLRAWWEAAPPPADAPPRVVLRPGGLTVLAGTQAWGFTTTPATGAKRE